MAFVDKTWELLLLFDDLAILGDEHDEEEEDEDEGAVIKPLIISLLFNLSTFVVVGLTLELATRRLSLFDDEDFVLDDIDVVAIPPTPLVLLLLLL